MSKLLEKSRAVRAAANMPDYQVEVSDFSWSKARALLDGFDENRLNIAYEAVDRHVGNGRGDKLALRWVDKRGQRIDYTYRDLMLQSNRFANVLQSLGAKKGDAVFSLLGRVPALYIAVLGTLKAGCVYCPMFSAFGPEPVKARMQIGEAKFLVTSSSLYKRKVSGVRDQLPLLEAVLLSDSWPGENDPDLHGLEQLLQGASGQFDCAATEPDDKALLHFTSGTTGKPKGAVHVHEAVVAHHYTGKVALDLKPDDVYWCTADPGWVTGTSYGIIAPLTNGVSMIIDEAEFDVNRWYGILESEKVNVWYTAPTAIRMLMKAGNDLPANYDLSSLRFMASVGEPLNPEAVNWSQEVLGLPFHDNWWQTETGGIMIANYAAMGVKPGSMVDHCPVSRPVL